LDSRGWAGRIGVDPIDSRECDDEHLWIAHSRWIASGAEDIRRTFMGGVAVERGSLGLSRGLTRFGYDPARPPQLYEYFLDNFCSKRPTSSIKRSTNR